jgi:hypothetical protein
MPLTLIEKVQGFCESNRFEAEFERFARENSHVFETLLSLQKGDEHPVAYYDTYNKYLSIFEGRIEEFVVKVVYERVYVIVIDM